MLDSEKYTIDIRPEAWAEISRIADMHLSLVGPASAKKITDQLLDDIELLDLLTIGMVNEMFIEKDNDDYDYPYKATQAQMDAF